MNTNQPTATGSSKVGDILSGFGAYLQRRAADGDPSNATLKAYEGEAGRFVAWCMASGLNPLTLTEDDLIDYRKSLIAQGYSRDTIALKLAAVRRLYDAAYRRGLRTDNPALLVKAPRARTAREDRVKFLPLDGLKQVLAAPEGDAPRAIRDRAMLALMGVHGLRVAEVAGLRMGDLDLRVGILHVLGKGRKTRQVYLTDNTKSALSEWVAVRKSAALPRIDEVFVVVGNHHNGEPISERGIRWLVDDYLSDLGLKGQGVSCHSLRHSAATWARAGGAKLDAIAAMLGHSHIGTTQTYAAIVDKIKDNPARFLEALLAARGGPGTCDV